MRRIIFFISFFLVHIQSSLIAQVVEVQNLYEAQAVYLYNICKYMQWPDEDQKGNFIIGVFSNDPIASALTKIASTRKYVNQTIEIKIFKTIEEITKTQVLFVPGKKINSLTQIVSKIDKNTTLIISDKKGSIALGSAINFVLTEDGKLKFELKKSNILDRGIKLNNSLEKLAIRLY